MLRKTLKLFEQQFQEHIFNTIYPPSPLLCAKYWYLFSVCYVQPWKDHEYSFNWYHLGGAPPKS